MSSDTDRMDLNVVKLADAIIAELRQRGPLPRLAVTEAEAAEMLGVSPRTVYALRKRGLLRPIVLDTASKNPPVRYAVRELEDYLARERLQECNSAVE